MSERQYKKKKCIVCQKEHCNRGQTCSKDCANKKRRENSENIDLTCILCGNIFHTKDGTGKYCNSTHYKKCEVCGKDFPITKGKESKENPTCGFSCGAVYSHRKESSKILRKENSLKKWGVENPLQAHEVKEKINHSLTISGKNRKFGSVEFQKLIKETYGVDNVSELDFVKEKKSKTFKTNYIDKGIYPSYGPVSKINLQWKNKLEEETGVLWELEHYFSQVGKIDLYAENNGNTVAVEINPTATHNSYYNFVACTKNKCNVFPCPHHTIDKMYHYNRSNNLKQLHNISLTSIFDWMDEEKMISFIRSRLKLDTHKIYAKKTSIVSLTQTEANKFLKNYHLMNGSRLQEYCYGLMYDNELVQVQTFSRMGKDSNIFEAKRLATKTDWAVIGGVSKITKHFIKQVDPDKIIAFSDLNLSYPDYDLSFNDFKRVGVNKPQKCWSKGSQMILDKSAARQSADRLLKIANNSKNSIYPEDWSNEQVFLAEHWYPVWDCGMIKDEWTK